LCMSRLYNQNKKYLDSFIDLQFLWLLTSRMTWWHDDITDDCVDWTLLGIRVRVAILQTPGVHMVPEAEATDILLEFGEHDGGVVHVDEGFVEDEASQMAFVVINEVLEFVHGFFRELTEVFDE
jgi:hypothetical protein